MVSAIYVSLNSLLMLTLYFSVVYGDKNIRQNIRADINWLVENTDCVHGIHKCRVVEGMDDPRMPLTLNHDLGLDILKTYVRRKIKFLGQGIQKLEPNATERCRFGVAVTRWSRSTKLFYAGPG